MAHTQPPVPPPGESMRGFGRTTSVECAGWDHLGQWEPVLSGRWSESGDPTDPAHSEIILSLGPVEQH